MPRTQWALLALALAYLVQACSGFSWAQCGEGAFAVKDVTLTPDPVAAGDNAVFKITANSGACALWALLDPCVPWKMTATLSGWALAPACC